ncbi:MAG: ABC transporter ATP-binding protein [Gammaproteobacteria bacterium]|nr:ABC transporter ATP-binding protein [Gammaproteobacteria bacterium]
MTTSTPASLELRAVDAIVDREAVLNAVDLDALPGELLFVLGGRGAGKSTLLRCIAGVDPIAAGSIRIDGRDINALAPRQRNVALMPQSFPLWPNRTIADNIAFGLRQRGLRRGAIIDRVRKMLRHVGLLDFADHLPDQLSAGQRQRAALARTLAPESPICLLDEPCSAQDALLRRRVMRLLRQDQQLSDQTMLLTTQDPDEALLFGDRIALLHDGRLQQVGTAAELYDEPANRYVAEYLGNANLIDGEIEIDGEQALFRSVHGIAIPLFDHALKRPRRAIAMFRPRDLQLVGGKRMPRGGEIRISGRVQQSEFLGEDLRFGIDTVGGTLWMDLSRRNDEPMLNVGDRVALALDPARVRILER